MDALTLEEATKRLPMTSATDRIEKKVMLRASRSRVWRAITDSGEFGSWFGMRLDGPFQAGAVLRGAITPTTVDEEVARMQRELDGFVVELRVEAIEPERLFSFRWHPFAIDKAVDYSKEEMTLVSFQLEESAQGTLLTVTESGFDRVPIERRAKAFAANEGGWAKQCEMIEKYLAHAS
jgi:uncharacterized protein YndB with AHSA1/START domain